MKSHQSSIKKIPELLAPAGNIDTALAAYQSGADAVYFGLDKYNARIPAENFSVRDLSKIAGYAKSHGKKYYLTFNTLIKEGELEDAARQLEIIAEYEPDAVIVQDLGIVRMVRDLFPFMPVHASTQMGIHNSAGVAAAGRLGIERVILERQVTMEELSSIVNKSELEIEVFVHGALCCSLSGRCLFSSWIGGWSGNRGRCKQPCRRRYYGTKNGSKRAGFYFSTQDLYMLDLIPQLKEIGVDSLKIEGRLRKPDYVQSVVSAYRMMLDAPDGETDQVIKRAKQVLSGSYGRRWSHGFASDEDLKTVLQPDSVGVSGLLIGSAEGSYDNKLRVKLTRKLHVGDRIRVQKGDGQEGPSFTVRGMEEHGRPVKSCTKGEVFIPVDPEMYNRGKVYKISQSMKRTGPSVDTLEEFVPRRAIDLSIQISKDAITVTLTDQKGMDLLKWEKEIALQEAHKHSVNPEEVKRVFNAVGIDTMRAGKINVDIQPGLFMPPSILKKLRREFWDFAGTEVKPEDLQEANGEDKSILEKLADIKLGHSPRMPKSISCAGQVPRTQDSHITVEGLYSLAKKGAEVELPHFCSESALQAVTSRIEKAVQSGTRRFRVTDLYQFELLRAYEDIEICVGFPFPAANSMTMQQLKEFGVSRAQAWIELDRNDITGLIRHSPLRVEVYRYGRPFILVTRAKVAAEGNISDPRGKKFKVEYSSADKLSYLYPFEIVHIPEVPGADEFWDYRRESWGEKVYSSFNFETEYV